MQWQRKVVCREQSPRAAVRRERFFRELLGRMRSDRQTQATPTAMREIPSGPKSQGGRTPRAGTHQTVIPGIPRSWNTPLRFARTVLLSAMTYRAIRQLPRRIDGLAGGLNVAFRMPVTLQTPFHEQRVFPPRHRHLVHWSMARCALDSAVHVNAMVEIDEIRQIVDTCPL